MHGQRRVSATVPCATIRVMNRAGAASGGRPRSQARTRRITAHWEFGVVRPIRPNLVLVVLLLVGIRNVGHVLQVGELAIRSAGMTKGAAFGLDCSLGVNVLVPGLHGIFILVADDEVVDNPGITLPENLNAIEACS